MELQALVLSILLLSILTGSEAKSLDQPLACSQECSVGTLDSVFRPGYEYSYSYETTVVSSFHTESARDQRVEMNIKVPFTIQSFSKCDLMLQLGNDMSIDGRGMYTREEREWRDTLAARPLRFVWRDGVMDTLCPSEDEPVWALNFKRGILSSMQISEWKNASSVKESDVSGQCESSYQIIEKERGELVFKKVKDYSKCVNRDRHLLFSFFTAFESQSPRQNFIHSEQSCEVTMSRSGSTITNVACDEEHVFRPFSTDQSGARTKINQAIVFQQKRRGYSGYGTSRSSLRSATIEFEEEPEQALMNQRNAREGANNLVNEICSTMDDEAYDQVSKQFVSLVFSLRRLDFDTLSEFNSQLGDSCSRWSSTLRQMFQDALQFCGTEACVKFASRMILTDGVKKNVAERWLAGFSFIREPTTGMLSSLLDLVENQKMPESSYLAIGNMVHQICTRSEDNCMNDNDIRNAIEVLMQHLGTNCRTSNGETKKKILLTLRAIGNAGYTTSTSTLNRCIADEYNEMEVRVAAVQAFRRMQCNADRSTLLSTLNDEQEDSELRITSYIALMQCPTFELVSRVKKLLEEEKNMQVGSFIWSHLTEVMESKDPLKFYIQRVLSGESFKEFNLDPRKYSRHLEASMFSEKLNAGGTVEGNLVWSPKSFIPRSASVNLTVNLFGQAVNLMEFGGRVQGVEKYLQEFLEPEAFKKRQARSNVPEPLSPGLRDIEKQHKARAPAVDEPRGSWYMRVFGNELLYGNNEMLNPDEEEDSSNVFLDFVAKLMTDEGYNYHDDSLLLNSAHILPTGIGLPLEVAFNGSSSVDLHASGKFNPIGLLSNNAEYVARGNFNPRAAVVITGSMVLNAHVRRNGIATESTALTSATVAGYAKISDQGNSFEFRLDTPYNENVAFKFKHKLLKIQGGELRDLETSERRPMSQDLKLCTNEFLGQRFCFTKQYVTDRYSSGAPSNAIFPMDGPLEISAYLEKTDRSLVRYTVTGNKRNFYADPEDTIPERLAVQLTFDTPGSTVNRQTDAQVSYDLAKNKFSVSARKGTKRYLVQGSYKSDENSKTADISAVWDRSTYAFHTNFERTKVDEETEWRTNSYLQMPHKRLTADGGVTLNPGKRATADLTINNVLPDPIVMKLDLQDKSQKSRGKLSYSGEGKLSVLPYINNGFMFDLSLKPKLSNMMLDAEYKINDGAKQKLLFHHKRTDLSTKSKTDWNIDHAMTSTQFPSLNHKMEVTFQYAKEATRTVVEIGYGARIQDDLNPNKLKLTQEYANRGTGSTTDVTGLWSLESPYLGIDQVINFEHFNNKNKLSSKVYGHSSGGSPYNIQALWENLDPESDRINRKIDFQFPTPYGQMQFEELLEEQPANVYTSQSQLSLGEASELRFTQETKVTNLPNSKNIEISVRKGDGTRMFDASSFNTLKENSVYSSINNIEVTGYEPRGINVVHRHTESEGYPVEISYFVSGVERVGMNFKILSSDLGKDVVMSVNQRHVQERTVTAKVGYKYSVKELFDVYGFITKDERTLLGTRLDLSKPNTNSKRMSVHFEETLSADPLDFTTTVEVDHSASSVEIAHAHKDKMVKFSGRKIGNGVSGELTHNFCEYLNEATFRITRSDNAVSAVLTSGRRRAYVDLSRTPNKLEARLNNSIRDLNVLGVPTSGRVSLERSDENERVPRLSMSIESDSKTFETSCSFDDSRTREGAFDVRMEATLSNSLFETLPGSSNAEIKLNKNQWFMKASKNRESSTLTLTQDWPRSLSIQFSHNCRQLQEYEVPYLVKVGYQYEESSKSVDINFDYNRRHLECKVTVTSDRITGSFTNQGFDTLPSTVTFDGTGSFERNLVTMDAALGYNDKKYESHIKIINKWKASPTSNIPYLKYVGETSFDLNVTQDTELLMRMYRRFAMTDTSMKNMVVYNQTYSENPVKSLHEVEEITISDEEYGYTYTRTINNQKPTHMKVAYRPDESSDCRVELQHGQDWNVPRRLCLSVASSKGRGRRSMILNANTENGARSARMSYAATEERFAVDMDHDFDYAEYYVPKNIHYSIGVEMGPVTTFTMDYSYGTDSGSIKASWDNDAKKFDMLVHLPKAMSEDIHVVTDFSYSPTSFAMNTVCTYGEQTYSAHTSGLMEYMGKSKLMPKQNQVKLAFNASLDIDGREASTVNAVELTDDYLFVQTLNRQELSSQLPPKFDFTRKFSWRKGNADFELRVDGAKGEQPLIVSGEMIRQGTTMISLDISHNQDEWVDTIPKNFFIKVERTSSGPNTHTLKVTSGRGRRAKSITATLNYASSETDKSFDLTVNNEFYPNAYQVPETFKLTGSYSKQETGFTAMYTVNVDEKSLTESVALTYGDQKGLTYHRKVTGVREPMDISFEAFLTITNSEVAFTSSTSMTGFDEPQTFTLRWSREPGLRYGNWQFSHNLKRLPEIPRILNLQMEPSEDLNDLNINLEVDGIRRKFSIRRALSGNTFEVHSRHDFDYLESEIGIPKEVDILVRLPNFDLKWGDKYFVLNKVERGFTMTQNMVEGLPGTLTVDCKCDLSNPNKVIDMKTWLDSKLYQFYFGYNYNFAESDNSVNFDLRVVGADDILVDLNTETQIASRSALLNITFSQGCTDAIPRTSRLYLKFQGQENGGSVVSKFTIGGEPVSVDARFEKISDMKYSLHIIHNREDMSAYLPLETHNVAEASWSDVGGEVILTSESPSSTKSVSFGLAKHIREDGLDLTLTFTHNLDTVERELQIPKKAKWTLSRDPTHFETEIEYTLNSEEKSAGIHALLSDTVITVKLDQNIIETVSTSAGRRSSTEFPKKMTVKLTRSEPGSYKSAISFKFGQKRKYFNAEYTAIEGEVNNSWKMGMTHNLNRILPFDFPTNFDLEINLNSTAFSADVVYGPSQYGFGVWRDTTERRCKVGARLTLSDNNLLKEGVPSHVFATFEIGKTDPYMTAILKIDEKTTSFHMGYLTSDNMQGLQMNFSTDEYDRPITMTTTLKAIKSSDTGYTLEVSGEQKGLNKFLPPNFDISVKLTLDSSSSSISFLSSHNIPKLKSEFQIPSQIRVTVSAPVDMAEKTFSLSVDVHADDLYSTNSIDLDLHADQAAQVTFSGSRTKGFWSRNPDDLMSYEGKSVVDTRRMLVDWQYSMEEKDARRRTTQTHSASLQIQKSKTGFSFGLSMVVPPINDLGMARSIEMSLRSGNFNIDVVESDGSTSRLRASVISGRSFRLVISKADQELMFNFDMNSEQQLTFRHNLRHEFFQYIPQSIIGWWSQNKKEIEIKNDSNMIKLLISLTSDQIIISCNVTDIGTLIHATAQYRSHPKYMITSELEIPLLKIHYSLDAEIQFFMQDTGKSEASFTIVNKRNSQQFAVAAEAGLIDETITNLHIEFSVKSTMPAIPLNIELVYHDDGTALIYRFTGSYGMYSASSSVSDRDFLLTVNLPRTYKVYQVSLKADCTGFLEENNLKSEVALRWSNRNGNKYFTVTTTMGESTGTFDIEQNAFEFRRILGQYSIRKRNGQYNVHTSIQQDEKSLTVDVSYSQNRQQGVATRTLVVDITQPFNIAHIPRQFVTTGIVKMGTGLYDSYWKITSGENDLVVLKKFFKYTDHTCNLSMHWKQENVFDFPVMNFDSSVDIESRGDLVRFDSRMRYNRMPEMVAYYNWTLSNEGRAYNLSMGFTYGDRTYKTDLYYSKEYSATTGTKITVVENYYMPEGTKFFSMPMPSEQHESSVIFYRNKNIHFKTRYHNSYMKHPMELEGMYVLMNGNKLFDSTFSVKTDPDNVEQADFEAKFTIDLVEGITFSMKMPSIGIDSSLNVMYTKSNKTLQLRYTVAGKQPVVIRVNLQQFIPHLKSIWEALLSLPKVELIGGCEENEAYVGIQIRDVPYTLHFEAGSGSGKKFFRVLTKRRFTEVDELVRVEIGLADPENVQITVTANKKLSRVFNMAVMSCHAELKDRVTAITAKLIEFLESLKEVVEDDSSDVVRSTINKNIDAWISKVGDFRTNIYDLIESTKLKITSSVVLSEDSTEVTIRKTIEILTSVVEKLREIVSKPLQQLKQDYLEEISTEILNVIRPLLQPVTRLLNQVHAGTLFLELVQEGVSKTILLVDKNVAALLNAAKEPLAELVYVSENSLTINIPLSFAVKGLVGPPSMKDITLWVAQSSLAHELDGKMKILYKAIDYYYQYRSVLNMPLDEIIPPFKGHAEMSGFRHFRTFDGRRYDFMSRCESSHVVAHDFRDHDFTVLVTYGSMPSVIVRSVDSNGRYQSVVLHKDYSVTDEEGRDVPVPVEYGDMTVTRTGEVVTVKTALGLTLKCNFISDLCTFDVSPFYFAGIAGMAGTFNNEPYDDFTGPSITELGNTDELARSWMTPGSCDPQSSITRCAQPSGRVSHGCAALFSDQKSDFYSCFPVEDPEPYLQMCIQDACRSSLSNTCSAASAYARRCALRGVNLRVPDSCAKCNSASGFDFSSSKQVPVSGADVVFVIEKSGCLKFKKKDYKKLLSKIHTTLNSTIATGNLKYAVVGFGGPGELAAPHTITLGKDIFMQTDRSMSSTHERELMSALKRGEKTNTESDVLEALNYAAQLPFRAGASRTIILFTCSSCAKSGVVKNSAVQALLDEQGIVVHRLHQKNIQAAGSSKKVYGFNRAQVFSRSRSDSLARTDLKIARDDQCFPLVDRTGGSFWNANMFNRDSMDYIVGEVRNGVNSVRLQDCVCATTDNLSATAKCTASR